MSRSREGAAADPDVVVRCRGLRKVYRTGFWLRPVVGLQGLDLDVHRGEVFGIVGPNGAGKTTTIKILTGLQDATAGEAIIFGRPYDEPATRKRLGFLPERPYFYDHLSARELLDFYGRLFEVPHGKRSRRIDELLERVELTRFADIPLRKYSKGMVQRVGLCQTLLHDPELIVLDEPMSGLDPLGRALVRDVILEERDRGCTVIFSSHILSDVESLSDRVAMIVGGKLRGVGTVQELIGHRVQWIDLRYAGAEDVETGGEVLRDDPGSRLVRLAPERSDASVATILAAGGRIIELTPVRETLESVLLDEVEAARPVDHKRMGVL